MEIELPLDQPPPRLRVVAIAVAVTWASAVVGVATGLWLGDWRVAVYAFAAAANAAGWWMAVRRWALWRTLAYGTLLVLDEVRRGHPDG